MANISVELFLCLRGGIHEGLQLNGLQRGYRVPVVAGKDSWKEEH